MDWTHTQGKQFAKWKNDKEAKEAYEGNLLRIMDYFIVRYVGAVIPGEVYRSLTDDQRQKVESLYLLCLQYCLHAAALEAIDQPKDVKVDVVIAERPGLKGKARELYQLARKYLPPEARERLSTTVDILEMPKGEPTDDEKPAVLLQAADIVAYELGQYAQGKDRYPMRQLMKTDEHYYWHIFDKGLLNAACQTWTPD